jgi:hypothetical protein
VTAANGGGQRRTAGGPDFECPLHRKVARTTAKPSRAALLAKMQRGQRTMR